MIIKHGIIVDTADRLATFMKANWAGANSESKDFAKLLEEAINRLYGNKEQFFKKFLSILTEEQVQLFFEILNEKMRLTNVDSKTFNAIKEALKKAGAGEITAVEGKQRIAPSTTTGMSPYRHGGKGK